MFALAHITEKWHKEEKKKKGFNLGFCSDFHHISSVCSPVCVSLVTCCLCVTMVAAAAAAAVALHMHMASNTHHICQRHTLCM